ncbi:MAG: aromatic acid exporter family protein [Actinomycetota bacterium]|nr:aromatic acid exporter family protein [Actinomycetota bacterium]
MTENGPRRSAGDVVARLFTVARERFRRGGAPALGWALRLTAAATAAYIAAHALFPDTKPLLAPLTALLVVQLTPVSLLASGADRVLSVVTGVSVAALFATVVDVTWWSLAIMIAVSILIGQLLRIGANLIEVPISAMLVLGVGSLGADSAAWQRFSGTLVGAAVGVASNLLFPPKVGAQDAGRAIEGLGKDLADLLDRAGDRLADEDATSADLRETALAWLDDARRLTHGIPEVGTALLRAEESRRLNLRAAGTVDPGPGLRQVSGTPGLSQILADLGIGAAWSLRLSFPRVHAHRRPGRPLVAARPLRGGRAGVEPGVHCVRGCRIDNAHDGHGRHGRRLDDGSNDCRTRGRRRVLYHRPDRWCCRRRGP